MQLRCQAENNNGRVLAPVNIFGGLLNGSRFKHLHSSLLNINDKSKHINHTIKVITNISKSKVHL